MGGYSQTEFDPGPTGPRVVETRIAWWKQVLAAVTYTAIIIFLWIQTDYPKSFGVQIRGRGNTAVLGDWYYSYLLLQRHGAWDVLTFACMWLPPVGYLAWIAFKALKRTNFSLYSDDSEGA